MTEPRTEIKHGNKIFRVAIHQNEKSDKTLEDCVLAYLKQRLSFQPVALMNPTSIGVDSNG